VWKSLGGGRQEKGLQGTPQESMKTKANRQGGHRGEGER